MKYQLEGFLSSFLSSQEINGHFQDSNGQKNANHSHGRRNQSINTRFSQVRRLTILVCYIRRLDRIAYILRTKINVYTVLYDMAHYRDLSFGIIM